jgi:hypothetical protein
MRRIGVFGGISNSHVTGTRQKIQAIPGETDVSVPTTSDSEIEAYIVARLKEEAKSREDLVESLAVARKRVLEASEVHFYFPKNLGGQTNVQSKHLP